MNVRLLLIAAVVLLSATGPARAQQAQAAGEAQEVQPLKSSVALLGANATNDAIALPAASGPFLQDLYFQIQRPLTTLKGTTVAEPSGMLAVIPLQATTPPGDVVAITLALAGSAGAAAAGPVAVPLPASSIQRVRLQGPALRRDATYKGRLLLSAAGQSHSWEITVTTAGRGVLKAIAVGPLQFTALPTRKTLGSFSVTLSNRSDIGLYHNLRAYAEGPAVAASKSIRDNLLTDHFSFFDDEKLTSSLPLDRQRSAQTVEADRRIWVQVARLTPGEYSGSLRFAADETAVDTDDSKLPLIIHVRHHWVLPVLVLVVGSIVGWFGTKYVVAARKSRDLRRRIAELRVHADHLARRENSRSGWMFPSEGPSFALIKARVLLSQLAGLLPSPMAMLSREEELTRRRQDAELRLSRLERFRQLRQKVQLIADGRPAAQVAIGRLLRQAITILEEPVLNEARIAAFDALLEKITQWPNETLAQYRAAVLNRRGSVDIPPRTAVEALTAAALRERLLALLQLCPAESAFADASMDALQQHDRVIAEIALLWRERERDWATVLADAAAGGAALPGLFERTDRSFWELLKQQRFTIQVDTTSEDKLRTFDLVEISVTPPAAVSTSRLVRHPLHVIWSVTTAGGTRTIETDGLTLVQYFNKPGRVRVTARLTYAGEDIPVDAPQPLAIVNNPEYASSNFFWGFTEWAPLLIATVFATATAMSAQYDSTFGSYPQYLALFIWAAGAATGGNLFKQLGTESAPGGSIDSALAAK